ncbi:hypothetical protein [Streptomyces sp. WMMC940]|uniref:hypothetical protein n=1 Tax=Streptomyces sp. WMMC940 TaxID=3015153 RepID=UPI0022B72C17|nr:hypothetical protein [Streptomyces sp. WMMC940]MCZ7456117.1 hypothetical protein [Streptomyces sp. WMMC940]
MANWWRWRRIPFKDALDEKAFGSFAARTGWTYAGRVESEWFGPTPTWYSLDGAVIRVYPEDAVSVAIAEVSADEPEVHQRAMAEAEAMVRRAFRCFTAVEALSLLRSTSSEAKAPVLTAVAASASDRYRPDVGEVLTSALFAPQPSIRAAALRGVMLTQWPQLERPLLAHALTENEDDLARFAWYLAHQLYQQDADAYLIRAPDAACQDQSERPEGVEMHEAEAAAAPRPAAGRSLGLLLGAASGRMTWSP